MCDIIRMTPDMTPAKTSPRVALFAAGIVGSVLAAQHGICPSVLSDVLSGKRRTPRVRRVIAEALGKPYSTIWGEDDPGVDLLPAGRPAGRKSAKRFAQGAAP